MALTSVFRKSLRDQKWQIAGFGAALALVAALDVLVWPAYRDTLQNLELPPAFQAFLGTDLSIATPAGFLSTEFFSWIPILLIVYAVIQGTGAIGGEEGSGTMDMLLAQPVARTTIVSAKAAATCLGIVLIIAIGFIGFAITLPPVAIDVGASDVAVAMANMAPITLLFYALALWLGSMAPSRAMAVAGTIAVATAGWLFNTLAQGIDALRGLRYASPFYYYGAGLPIVQGIDWAHAALLLGGAAALFALTLRAFARRDVSVGGGAEVDVAGAVMRAVRGGRRAEA
jgi:ABC-2 type transport system permease protein